MPHHLVLNPNKPGKVRRVCNAASKFKGFSLNDVLLTGADLLAGLMAILARFRENAVALSADIEEMFLQVEVKPEDRKFLQFLWHNEDGDVVTYQYNRHIFGAKSSSTCTNNALQKCATDHSQEFNFASRTTLNNFYMDELLVSLYSKETALTLKADLTELLARGGFKPAKWATNFDEVTTSDKSLTILGLEWDNTKATLKVC